MSIALYRARTRAAESTRGLAAIQQLSASLTESRDPDDALAQVLDAVLQLTHTAGVRLWLANSETRTLKFRLHRGLFPGLLSEPAYAGFDDIPAGRAAVSRRALLLSDPQALAGFADKGVVKFASVPIAAGDKLIGVLDVAAQHRGELTAADLRRIESLGPTIALVIVNAERAVAAERRATGARRLVEASLEMASAPNYAETLRTIAERVRQLVPGDASALCIWDEQNRWWSLRGASGDADAFDSIVKRLPANGVECPIVRSNYRGSQLGVPVERGGKLIGCLCVAAEGEREFSSHENDLIRDLADQAAIAVDRARDIDRAGEHAVVTERERLAREMHDTLAQLLGFVSFKTQATREFLGQGRSERAQVELDQLMTIAQDLYADTRELILGLTSGTGPERELVPALDDYVRRFAQLSGVAATLQPDGIEGLKLAPLVEVQLIRVVQEALSNVRKHARAAHASVRLERADGIARLIIEDDGQGFDPARLVGVQGLRFGMQSMRERVESVGGNMAVRSEPGAGTQITVQVPIVYRGAE